MRYNGSETRQELLDAASSLYGTLAVRPTSIRDVITKAGVSKGAFYHHFPSKGHLIATLHTEYLDGSIDDISAIPRDLDPQQAFEETFAALFRRGVTSRAGILLYEREFSEMATDLTEAVEKRRQDLVDLIVDMVGAGRQRGHVTSTLGDRAIAIGVMSICVASAHWFDPMGAQSADEVGREFATILGRGLFEPSSS